MPTVHHHSPSNATASVRLYALLFSLVLYIHGSGNTYSPWERCDTSLHQGSGPRTPREEMPYLWFVPNISFARVIHSHTPQDRRPSIILCSHQQRVFDTPRAWRSRMLHFGLPSAHLNRRCREYSLGLYLVLRHIERIIRSCRCFCGLAVIVEVE